VVSSGCHFLEFRDKGSKIHKGFFFVQLCVLPIAISKIQALLAGRFKRRRRNVSHEENEDSKVHKGFSLRTVSSGLGYYFKNTIAS
jgi:hypothetical protein